MRYLKLTEVCETLEIEDELLRTVTAEGLVEIKHTTDDERIISAEHAERLRLIRLLLRDLDVNVAGVEIILHMREQMTAMQRQFDDVVRSLVDEMRRRLSGRCSDGSDLRRRP